MRRNRRNCCPKEIVHPVKQQVVNCCSEETVKHIHPSHTTVVNHHLVKNEHIFPHSTSVQNQWNSVDVYGGSFNTPTNNQVAGATQGSNSNSQNNGNHQHVGGMTNHNHCHCMGPGHMPNCHHHKKKWR